MLFPKQCTKHDPTPNILITIATNPYECFPSPLFCGLPPPLCFVLMPSSRPCSSLGLALLTCELLGLTFSESPPPSCEAVCCSVSGFVWFGSKAALELAASSSVPDCEYSVDLLSIESLPWLSLRGKEIVGVVVKQRWERADWFVEGCRV